MKLVKKTVSTRVLGLEKKGTWNMKCVIIPAIIGVTGIASKGLMKDVEAIPGTHSIFSLQKTAIRGTSHIIR
jgi:hypothetical protein